MNHYPTIWNFWYRGLKYGSLLGGTLGAVYGMRTIPIIGTLLGMLLGGGVGAVLGVLNSTLNAWITWLVYPRLSHVLYRVVLALSSGLFTGVGAFFAFCLLFDIRLDRVTDIISLVGDANVLPLAGQPAVIAMGAAIWAAGRIATWYIHAVTPGFGPNTLSGSANPIDKATA